MMQPLISGSVVTGVFLVMVAIATGLFARAKNKADAGASIVGGAKIVVDMTVEELQRKDAKIVLLHSRLNRLRAHIRELRDKLTTIAGEAALPALPSAYYDDAEGEGD